MHSACIFERDLYYTICLIVNCIYMYTASLLRVRHHRAADLSVLHQAALTVFNAILTNSAASTVNRTVNCFSLYNI